jgi:hypothetical protein
MPRTPHRAGKPRKKPGMMIAESFDRRTLANMEVALERACESLGPGSEQHDARRHIAGKILECAASGDRTLGGLTDAARAAVSELRATHGARPWAGAVLRR